MPRMQPVLVDRDAGEVALLARMVGAHQMLAPVLDPFHRPAQPQRREQHQHVLGIDLAADAEAAADMAFMHVQRRRAAAQHAAQGLAVAVGNFGGAVQFENVARGVVAAERAARLQRHARVAAGRKVELDDGVRGAQRRFDVAVAVAQQRGLAAAAGLELAGRIACRQHDRQRLDLDLDQLGRVLGQIRILREHGGHRIPDIAHAAARQRRLAKRLERLGGFVGTEIDRREIRDVGIGPHRHHAGQRARRRGVDRDDAAMGVGGAHHAHMQLMRKVDVAGIAALAGDQRQILEPGDRMAEHAARARRRRGAGRWGGS